MKCACVGTITIKFEYRMCGAEGDVDTLIEVIRDSFARTLPEKLDKNLDKNYNVASTLKADIYEQAEELDIDTSIEVSTRYIICAAPRKYRALDEA